MEKRDEPMFDFYNNESPTEVYTSMAGDQAKANPMSYFFQETGTQLKSNVNVFNGTGFNLGEGELPYVELVGPKTDFEIKLPENVTNSVTKKFESYSSKCNPEEKNDDCLKRIFQCDPDRPWSECSDKLDVCKDDPSGICRYDSAGSLVKKYDYTKPVSEVGVEYQKYG
jgi:hypothetical protein